MGGDRSAQPTNTGHDLHFPLKLERVTLSTDMCPELLDSCKPLLMPPGCLRHSQHLLPRLRLIVMGSHYFLSR